MLDLITFITSHQGCTSGCPSLYNSPVLSLLHHYGSKFSPRKCTVSFTRSVYLSHLSLFAFSVNFNFKNFKNALTAILCNLQWKSSVDNKSISWTCWTNVFVFSVMLSVEEDLKELGRSWRHSNRKQIRFIEGQCLIEQKSGIKFLWGYWSGRWKKFLSSCHKQKLRVLWLTAGISRLQHPHFF